MNKKNEEISKIDFYFFSVLLSIFFAYTVNYWALIGNPGLFNLSFSLKLLIFFSIIFVPFGILTCYVYYQKLLFSKKEIKIIYWVFGLILFFLILHLAVYYYYKIDLINKIIPFLKQSLMNSFLIGLLFWVFLSIGTTLLTSKNFNIKNILFLTFISCLMYVMAYGLYFAVGILLMLIGWN